MRFGVFSLDQTLVLGIMREYPQLHLRVVGHEQRVIAVNPNNDSQHFNLMEVPASENFKQLGNPEATGTVAPRAAHIGVIGTFVVLGNTFDGINGQYIYTPRAPIVFDERTDIWFACEVATESHSHAVDRDAAYHRVGA